MKKASIITINYNNCLGLRKTIQSVINQNYTNYEYIIIDGGSTDGSVEVIKEYAEHVDYWVSEPDKGIYNAMNKGILKATGEYCNFMNSGDCFYNIDVLNSLFSEECYEDILFGKYYGSQTQKEISYPSPITMMTLNLNHPCHQATFIKRNLFKDHLYDENYTIAADWKFYLEMIVFKNCTYNFFNITIVLFDQTGISSTNKEILDRECTSILSELLPKKIFDDYKYWEKRYSPILELIPCFNKTRGLHKLIYKLTALIININQILRRTRRAFH